MIATSISHYERELLLAHILHVSREYVLTHLHPYTKISLKKEQDDQFILKTIKSNFGVGAGLTRLQAKKFEGLIKRREQNEPLAYILGHKEFYGLDFKVDPNTLIPRPETEMLVETTLKKLTSLKGKISVIDVGTGSGNIIISIVNGIKGGKDDTKKFYGLDISSGTLRVARYNAKKYQLDKKIRLIRSDLLEYFFSHISLLDDRCIIVANLPYLSKEIYAVTMPDVKNFEPRFALMSGQDGLAHYKRLFRQIKILKKRCPALHLLCLMEISPEQKKKSEKLVKKCFPEAKPHFKKDLARKWRLCAFEL